MSELPTSSVLRNRLQAVFRSSETLGKELVVCAPNERNFLILISPFLEFALVAQPHELSEMGYLPCEEDPTYSSPSLPYSPTTPPTTRSKKRTSGGVGPIRNGRSTKKGTLMTGRKNRRHEQDSDSDVTEDEAEEGDSPTTPPVAYFKMNGATVPLTSIDELGMDNAQPCDDQRNLVALLETAPKFNPLSRSSVTSLPATPLMDITQHLISLQSTLRKHRCSTVILVKGNIPPPSNDEHPLPIPPVVFQIDQASILQSNLNLDSESIGDGNALTQLPHAGIQVLHCSNVYNSSHGCVSNEAGMIPGVSTQNDNVMLYPLYLPKTAKELVDSGSSSKLGP